MMNVGLTYREYYNWWKEKHNGEESYAPAVVGLILSAHDWAFVDWDNGEIEYWNAQGVKLYPRIRHNGIEFDLLIRVELEKHERLISVEFKDNDIAKVVHQAVARREYVHYSYISLCTRRLDLDLAAILYAYMEGIGIVLATDRDAWILSRARFTPPNEEGLKGLIYDLNNRFTLSRNARAMLDEAQKKITEYVIRGDVL